MELDYAIPAGHADLNTNGKPATLSFIINGDVETAAFCQKNNIHSDVENTITLAVKIFPSVKSIKLELCEDPEGEEERLAVRILTKCTVDEAFAAYKRFIEQWVTTTPWSASRKIWLSYSVE